MITLLTFGEAQIIGGIVPNLIAFGIFLGAIGYLAATIRSALLNIEKGPVPTCSRKDNMN